MRAIHRSLAGALAAAMLLAARCAPKPRPSHPNVILISIDTLRADHLNAYGYKKRQVSPAIDALAADGILFERHVSSAPWTTPSHMSLLTSLNPSAHGVTSSLKELMAHQYRRLGEGHDTLAEMLQRTGYQTAAFTGGMTVAPSFGFGRGFQSYDSSMAKLDESRVDRVAGWIESHRAAPFFVFWHTFEVHAPYLRTEYLRDVIPGERAAAIEKAFSSDGAFYSRVTPDTFAKQEAFLRANDAFTLEGCTALYDGGIRSADRWIGRLIETLKKDGLYDDTLIVLTSDHGEQLGEATPEGGSSARDARFFSVHGRTMYEEMTHIPLIVKLPGGRHEGRRVTAVTRAIDVMPTILEVAQSAPSPGAQGRSLRPLWRGRRTHGDMAVSESTAGDAESKSVRDDRYKYILSVKAEDVRAHGRAQIPAQPEAVELYDLASDPGERRNLLPSHSPDVLAVSARFDSELRRTVGERAAELAISPPLGSGAVEELKALGYVH